ncbi:MAG: tyrosine-protein phosphatase [Actinomycetota bacterium]
MIDTHCHLLPAVDDGPKDWDTTLRMLEIAHGDGIRKAIATPHWTGTANETERIRSRFSELKARCAALPGRIEPFLGQELILVPQLLDALRSGTALTLAESSYVLLETAQLEFGAFNHQAVFQLQASGYRIILAHPERVKSWSSASEELRTLVERGCYLQINAGSLIGSFGRSTQRTAEALVRRGWASLLASDAHSDSSRPPILSEALERCKALTGDRAAEMLVSDNPARVLCNELLPYPSLDANTTAERPKRWFWPWR